MDNQEEKHWYVARTRNDHEMKIREKLLAIGVEHFIPTQPAYRIRNGRKTLVEVPVVRNLIFIHATKAEALSLPNGYALNLWYMNDLSTHRLLVIPEKQMEDFKKVWDLSPDALCLSEEPLVVGGRVKVVRGDFMGIEGNILSMSNKTYVVVSLGAPEAGMAGSSAHTLSALLIAKVKIPKAYLIPV